MFVRLKRNWLAPTGLLYPKGVQKVPDDLKEALPKDAVALSQKEAEAHQQKNVPQEEITTISEMQKKGK